MKRRILSLSRNPELAKLRTMVLEQAGYDVTWPQTREEADRQLEAERFDLLLIGHSISGDSARHFAEVFRATNPQGKIVAIAATPYLTIKADRTVRSVDGPEVLLKLIAEALDGEKLARCS